MNWSPKSPETWSVKINSPIAYIPTSGDYPHMGDESYVATPKGIVGVYALAHPPEKPVGVVLSVAHKGRLYSRRFYSPHTRRGISILAHRFIKEII